MLEKTSSTTIGEVNCDSKKPYDATHINFSDISYIFELFSGGQDQIIQLLKEFDADHYIVICDQNVMQLHGASFLADIKSAWLDVHLLLHPTGETAKSLQEAERLIAECLKLGATRRSIVITLGGGVTGNLGGLVAGLLFRGIRLVHIPTTIMAMMDSVISMKQAVNNGQQKNVIGLYHTPFAVLADVAMLSTLSIEHTRSGLCELIKNTLTIFPQDAHTFIDMNVERLRNDGTALLSLVRRGIEAKVKVMADDKYEKKAGLVLEYGHTVGHALELEAEGRLSHGEAIGLGMLVAGRISLELGLLDQAAFDLHHVLLNSIGAPVVAPDYIDLNNVFQLLRSDNKRGYLPPKDDMYPMVLLEQLGKPWAGAGDIPLYPVEGSAIREGIKEIAP